MKKAQLKNTCFAVPRGSKWNGRPMAHADFRGTPTYFAAFKGALNPNFLNLTINRETFWL